MTHVSEKLGSYVIGALIGALLFYVLAPLPQVPEPFTVVHVTPQQMDAAEPDADRTLGERVTTRVVTPSSIAIAQDSAPERAQRFVDAYVRWSVEPQTPRLQLPVTEKALLLGYAGRLDGQLELYSVGSDHTRQRHVFAAGCEPVSWLYDGHEVFVQAGRWCWLDDVLGIAGVGALGYGLGAERWEFIAGGALSLALRKLIF